MGGGGGVLCWGRDTQGGRQPWPCRKTHTRQQSNYYVLRVRHVCHTMWHVCHTMCVFTCNNNRMIMWSDWSEPPRPHAAPLMLKCCSQCTTALTLHPVVFVCIDPRHTRKTQQMLLAKPPPISPFRTHLPHKALPPTMSPTPYRSLIHPRRACCHAQGIHATSANPRNARSQPV